MQLYLKKVLFILNLISHASANLSKEASKVIKNMEDCDITKAALEAIDFIEQIKNKSESETHIYHKASDRFFGTDALIDGGLVPGQRLLYFPADKGSDMVNKNATIGGFSLWGTIFAL